MRRGRRGEGVGEGLGDDSAVGCNLLGTSLILMMIAGLLICRLCFVDFLYRPLSQLN